jgi:DNA-binding NarL/FixJ family response regulator
MTPTRDAGVIRVVVADDEPLVRSGLRMILASDPGIEVVGEAGDGDAALDAVARHLPDVALLDIQMPGRDGLDAASVIRSRFPAVRVLIVTTFGDDPYIARAVELNLDGFLLKSADPYELISGVKAAVAGGTALSPTVARRIVDVLRRDQWSGRSRAHRSVEALTERERDVLGLVGQGLSNAAIARRLHLVEGTVKVHVSAILAKLGLTNRVQAAILAYRSGLTGRDGPAGMAGDGRAPDG